MRSPITHDYGWSSATQESANRAEFAPEQVSSAWLPNDQLPPSQNLHYRPIPSSFPFNPNVQSHSSAVSGNMPVFAQPVPQNTSASATLRKTSRDPHDRLEVPSVASRSRSNSKSSKRPSRQNTPVSSPDQGTKEHEVTSCPGDISFELTNHWQLSGGDKQSSTRWH